MAGHTASDEMCNLYLMLYSQLPFFWWCLDSHAVSEVSGWAGGLVGRETRSRQAAAACAAAPGAAATGYQAFVGNVQRLQQLGASPSLAALASCCLASALAPPQLHGPGGLPANGHLAPEMVIWQPPSKVKVSAGLQTCADVLVHSGGRGAAGRQAAVAHCRSRCPSPHPTACSACSHHTCPHRCSPALHCPSAAGGRGGQALPHWPGIWSGLQG